MIRDTPAIGNQLLFNQLLIKQLPNATGFIDLDFKVVFASDKWADEFHFESQDIVDKNIHDLIGPISEQWNNCILRCFKGEISESFRESYAGHNHKLKWLQWTLSPWYSENKKIIGAVVQFDDVSQSVNQEQKIEQLEFVLKETVNIGKIGNWKYNQSLDIMNCCSMISTILEVEEGFQYTLDNYINFHKIGYNRNTISMAIYSAMKNRRSWSEKLQIITAKGNYRWVKVSSKPLYNNGIYIGLIGIVQDITDYVLKEHETKSSENLLKTLINNLPLQIYAKDTMSRKLLANRSELDRCGITEESDIIGKDDFDIYDRTTAQKYREEDLEVMISQTPMLNKELKEENPDGTTNYYLSSKIALKGINGETTGLVGITMDISEIKEKEKELKSLIHVSSQQNKKLLNFAHIISHNLRSHSANFSMLLDFLKEEKDEEERIKIFNMLTDSSNSLMETLHNLNDIVSINTEATTNKKIVNLNDHVNNAVNNLSFYLDQNQGTVITSIPKDTYINVVPAYLESIMNHIITNAIKYKKPDTPLVIKFNLSHVQNYTVLSIEDNGLGLDMKKFGKKLFDMYKTFHGNRDAKGLGLYIAKNQIEAMNGKINANSQVGVGTTFNLYFNDEN
ncbi:Sensor histidine kinase RcsC [Arenibacter antarcticus]|uniref:histidine kinase n=1 Tax=Arenibacter antarcticus TaxID=2040469 RepID=A0ABW5VJX2_9FLAO|nr:PAS domain-containing protein [Arenibacter sp. H213]MCM4169671.1 hypothetical protein [Arenibacter sp. H213]